MNTKVQTFIAISVISIILLFGTLYSVLYNTYLDTSNPLLTHLPHPLSKTHYFATKSNPLNVYFIKQAWGWTTAAFFFSWLTSPPQIRTVNRILKYLAMVVVWLLFTSWFFGPAIFERVIVASGGQCVIALPSGDPVIVPHEFCYRKTTVTPETNPTLFGSTFIQPPGWRAVPRLRKGHDVSGHVFLLTLSALFLFDQLRPSFRVAQWSPLHRWAIGTSIVMIGISLFAIGTTAVYFHSPFEKLTGFLLGVACFAITQLPVFNPTTQQPVSHKQRTQ
ncbi:hypothetical protein BYT27DRAFT_7101927 [Phlegmacium glaucopus]|nr:hypothetical protein BYT27DRAFT_7101927 [Phlegmacium glaucopus]